MKKSEEMMPLSKFSGGKLQAEKNTQEQKYRVSDAGFHLPPGERSPAGRLSGGAVAVMISSIPLRSVSDAPEY